ncbi:hypothetical protein [Sulfitobacter guttiformis]|uniref:Type IV pilus biogenesis protein PilP n=1 Tax=Sulfitobacter guttiformis TaxID=74349 RepID=A0A420DNR0_9RHOB|nr:hypothetical protein [Sulfitobacter guttiformis]KIN73136.1 hypothetical protein Z949_2320 [Sulfitobacter guttiformis KCTC 32187]RKE95818.1 hypothetical protein C8N30_0359 [Sulfitobacter guttiformis]
MKPNFALSLSFEGIKLLHRAAGGWREVGEVPIGADDLVGELAVLRKTAASLEPGGVRTKLVIPASQIKYLTIDTVGLSEAARRKAAEGALHNATPYELSELAYDISMDGAKTHIAAVARETLAEAEAFATEHRFHPVSFVAVPDDAPYLGEPFFGLTEGAADLLEPQETVEPDGIAVVIVGAIVPPQAPEVAQKPAQGIPAPVAAAKDPPVEESPSPVVARASEPVSPESPTINERPDAKAAAAQDEIAPAPEPRVSPAVKPAEASVSDADPVRDMQVQPVADAQTGAKLERPQAPEPTDKITVAGKMPDPSVDKVAQKFAVPDPSVSRGDIPESKPAIKAEPDVIPAAEISTPTAKAAPAVGAVSASKAPATPSAAPSVSAPQTVPAPRPFKSATPIPDEAIKVPETAAPTGFSTRRATQITGTVKPVGGAQRIAVRTPNATAVAGPDTFASSAPAAAASAPISAAARSLGGFLSRRKPVKGVTTPAAAPVAALPATSSEAERMTVFGARTAQVGGKPRFLGLIMTVILLVFLAGVAAWAAVFLDEGLAGLIRKDTTRATASAPENQIDPEVIRTPEGVEPVVTGTTDGVQIAALDPVLSAQDTVAVEAAQNLRPEPQVPVITEAEAAARYAVSGIWPLAPETALSGPATPDTAVYRSGIDPVSTANDAFALPSPEGFETDVQLAAVVSPPPFGQQTALDQNGLIVPTNEGVITPQGFTLYASSPPLKPPATLVRFAAAPAIEAPAATSALAALRPKNRPAGLSERTERAELGGVSRVELAAFRPSLRPASLQDRANEEEAARKAAEQAAETAEARAAVAAQSAAAAAAAALIVPTTAASVAAPALVDATRLATAQSVRPDTRPRNFSRIVQRAQRATPELGEETRVAAAAATVAPRTLAPSLPSKASVARSATVKNAINLRKVNLIGIYGKPSSRRALVRLSNGRYQKVQVGDRIDGGRVEAIGNSELRYSRSGRSVVLQMP